MKYAVILAGGYGTRFWPLSRQDKPKQLMKFFSEKTILEETVDRIKPLVDSVYISTNTHLEKKIRKALPKIKLVVEPEPRDTLAAWALAISNCQPDDYLVFLASDHYIKPASKFRKSIRKALKLAKQDKIVAIGVKPSYPSTAYGYLQVNKSGKVSRFTEKPGKKKAQQLINNGALWNAGIFVAKVSTLLSALQEYQPKVFKLLPKLKGRGKKKAFERIPKISIDYALMEHAHNIYCVECDFSWTDLGSFDAVADLLPGQNSVLNGKLISENSADNIVRSEKTVALIDCDDMVIVDTEDALLVAPRSSLQKIKKLQSKLPKSLK